MNRRKSILLLWLLIQALNITAQTVQSFDFGTDPGKTTATAAGFTQSLTANGSFADLPDALQVSVDPASGFQNFAFTRAFTGLGGGLAADFTLSTELRISNLAGSGHENNDRWGLLLFGDPGNDLADTNGITAIVLAQANTTTAESLTARLVLRDGLNGSDLANAPWIGGPVLQDDVLHLSVTGTYLTPTELALAFTLSRPGGIDTQTITTSITGTKLSGTEFGGALRIKSGRSIEFDTLTLSAETDGSALPRVPETLVAQGPDGLIYSPYANEGQPNPVHTVPDFSRAGYEGGGVPIPFIPAVLALDPQPGDDTQRLQDAINTVSALPLGPNGFRGALLLRAGDYEVSSTLTLSADGVVIRGEGSQANGGTRITHTAKTQSNLFRFQGSAGPATVSGSTQTITDALVPVGSRTLTVSDASGFAPGDLVRVTNTVNQAWIDAIGMNLVDPAWTPSGFQQRHFRYITAVNGNTLTLDAPIVQAIEAQYGGGTVERLTYPGALRNVGIEAIRLESTFTSDTDENHGWVAVEMNRVLNGWVRQVTSRYFGLGLVLIDNASLFVTVEDCAALDPKSITTGGRKYSFYVDDSSYVFMQRNLTRGGRHDYVSGSLTPGPNVFADSLATLASNDVGPHFRYATGELYDNIKTNNQINVQNRFNSGTSHGWSGAQIMFWNVEAGGIISDAPTGAMNWTVGAVGTRQEGSFGPESAAEPFGIWESHNTPVQPRSLYFAQLEDRLGPAAARRIMLPAQHSGTLWTDLLTWDGNGLFGPPLLLHIDTDTRPAPGTPLPLRATLRDLLLHDSLTAAAWTLLSGPGTVTFTAPAALATDATFSSPGIYLLELTVTSPARTETARISVSVLAADADTSPPAAPEFFTATYTGGAAQLQWQPGPEPDVVSYTVYRSLIPNDTAPPRITALPTPEFTESGLTDGTRYYYSVTAVDADGNESPRSTERFITVLDTGDTPALSVPATDSSWVRAAQDVQDASQNLLVKRADFTGTARAAFLRFPLSAPATLGSVPAADLAAVTLALTVTGHQPGDTLRLYALLDNARSAPAQLTETTWTGGSDGTAAGGNNLTAANRPDGPSSLPNPHTTAELGSLTFPGLSTDPPNTTPALHTIEITSLEAFRTLLTSDTNGEITLLLRGQLDREFNTIASTFNTQGHLGPTLSLVSTDSNRNSIPDTWEQTQFGAPLAETDTHHPAGPAYYFLYLSGWTQGAPLDEAGHIAILPAISGSTPVITWNFAEGFALGTDADMYISTDLLSWDPLPPQHYTHSTETLNGTTRHALSLTHEYETPIFLRLQKP